MDPVRVPITEAAGEATEFAIFDIDVIVEHEIGDQLTGETGQLDLLPDAEKFPTVQLSTIAPVVSMMLFPKLLQSQEITFPS